jgi:hypothetical protein
MFKMPLMSSMCVAMAAGVLTSVAAARASGPDVIVGDLPDFASYAPFNGVSAFAIGTTSCNIGDTGLNWISTDNRHPVIGQNLYRYKVVNGAGQFEQIGASWLKHGFTALQGTVCSTCPIPNPDGTKLAPGCSDPYSSGLNGSQARLGPRSQVNPSTGVYTYPFTASAVPADTAGGTIWRRLQVPTVDVVPTSNVGAIYFAEGQYIAQDDAGAGNGANNASYRRVSITGTSGNLTMSALPNYPTQRTLSAINGWTTCETGVTIRSVGVQGDGYFDLAYKVTALANGMYHYEYVLHNLNSDRGAQYFQVNFPTTGIADLTTIANTAVRGAPSHSGEPYSNTAWSVARTDQYVRFGAAQSFTQNPNANALRWGNSYTLRFDSDMAPVDGLVTIGLFKPSTLSSVDLNGIKVPGNLPCIGDFNHDGGNDGADIGSFFSAWEQDVPSADVNRDGGVDGSDVEKFFVHWAVGC